MGRIDQGIEQPAVHEFEQVICHVLISVMEDLCQFFCTLLIFLKDRNSFLEGLHAVVLLPGDRRALLDPSQKCRDQEYSYDKQKHISQHLSEKICIRPSSYVFSYCHVTSPVFLISSSAPA